MNDQKMDNLPTGTLQRKILDFIKENTPQIAIAIPIVAAIYSFIVDCYFYIFNRGYYYYFKIDANLMLPNNKINLYQYLGQFALVILYWGFSIFAVRMFLLKKNYLWKIFSVILIPYFINGIIVEVACDSGITISLFILSFVLLPIQWIMIFSLGYCMVISFHQETIPSQKKMKVQKSKSKRIKNKKMKSAKGNEKQWGDKEYKLLGILLIFVSFIVIFLYGYFAGNRKATNKRYFGIVEINQEQYAVIDANEDKLILQKCEIDRNLLKINYNTYLCTNNNIGIEFKTFGNVV